MWSVASTVLQDLCPNQAVVGAAAGTVLSPKRGRSWSLRLGREELSLHSLGRLGHVPLETRGYPSPLPGRGWREVTHLFVPLPLILNPVYHRELSPSGLSKQSVNRIFTPFVQYSEKMQIKWNRNTDETCTHLNSLVQDGRGIFRMAIIENKKGSRLSLRKVDGQK